MIETPEDRERLLRRAGRRGGQRVTDGGRLCEGLQRGREDLREQLSGPGAPVERGDPIGDLTQDVGARLVGAWLVAARWVAIGTALLVGLVSSGALIHVLQRTCVRFRSEGLRRICGWCRECGYLGG